MFGAPAMISMPRARAARAASMCTGNSLMRMPSRRFSSISSSVRSSWLASGTSCPATRASKARRLGSRHCARWACNSCDAAFDDVVRHAFGAAQRAVAVEVGVLADAGAVVHQADHAQARIVDRRLDQLHHVGGRKFAAQMQEMLAFQQAGGGQRVEVGDAVADRSAAGPRSKPRSPTHSASSTVVTPAAAHCASCASIAERDGQRAVLARLHLAFQIVGVHVDRRRG